MGSAAGHGPRGTARGGRGEEAVTGCAEPALRSGSPRTSPSTAPIARPRGPANSSSARGLPRQWQEYCGGSVGTQLGRMPAFVPTLPGLLFLVERCRTLLVRDSDFCSSYDVNPRTLIAWDGVIVEHTLSKAASLPCAHTKQVLPSALLNSNLSPSQFYSGQWMLPIHWDRIKKCCFR